MPRSFLTPRAARAERARELSERFRSLLEHPQSPRPAGLIGVEHEFTLRTGDRVLDFRDLIHTLPVAGLRIDPNDPNAYRCEWGGTITADGREAEIATPPVPVAAGFSGELTAWSDRGRASLGSVLSPSIEVSGYSTHLNLQMPDRLNDAVCDGVIRRFVPALMLLTERADSPGVLVRPRPGRLEVGTEFVDGPSLRAAAVLLAGGVRALADAIRGRDPVLPASLGARVLPASERFGWFVPRDAYGDSLELGAWDRMLGAGRDRIRARDQLEAAFESAIAALGDDLDEDDLAAVAAVLATPAPPNLVVRGSDGLAPTPFSALLAPQARPGFDVRAAVVTWDTSVFRVGHGRRSAFATVPRDSLPSFLSLLGAGDLDPLVTDYLSVRSQDRVLGDRAAAERPGIFDRVGAPGDILPPERQPMVPGGVQGNRPGKRHRDDDRQRRPRRPRPRWQVAAGVAAAVVLVAGSAFALSHKGGGTAASPVATTPTGSPTPSIGPALFDPLSLATARLDGVWSVPDWGAEGWTFVASCATGPCGGSVAFTSYIAPDEPVLHDSEVTYASSAGYMWDANVLGWCHHGDTYQTGAPFYRGGAAFQWSTTITVTEARQIDGELRATQIQWSMQGTSGAADAAATDWGCPAAHPYTQSGTGTLASLSTDTGSSPSDSVAPTP